MSGRLIAVTVLVAMGVWAAAAAAEVPDAETVIARVVRTFATLQDLQTDVTVQTPTKQSTGSIVLEYVSVEDAEGKARPRVRRYKLVTRTRVGDDTVQVTQVNDGEHLWVEVKSSETGKVTVRRRKVGGGEPVPGGFGLDFRKRLVEIIERFRFQTVGAGTYRDEPTVFLQGTPRRPVVPDEEDAADAEVPERIEAYVSSKDYFPRRVVLVMPPAKEQDSRTARRTVAVELLNVRLNKGLEPETFLYRPPTGAEVKDAD